MELRVSDPLTKPSISPTSCLWHPSLIPLDSSFEMPSLPQKSVKLGMVINSRTTPASPRYSLHFASWSQRLSIRALTLAYSSLPFLQPNLSYFFRTSSLLNQAGLSPRITWPLPSSKKSPQTSPLSSTPPFCQGYDELWNSTDSITNVGNGQVLNNFMYYVYSHLLTYDQWTNFGTPWFSDYAASNDGRTPAVGPSALIRCNYARDNLIIANYNEAARRKEVFKNFMETSILLPDAETCSSSIVLMPWTGGETNYRVSSPRQNLLSISLCVFNPLRLFSSIPLLEPISNGSRSFPRLLLLVPQRNG